VAFWTIFIAAAVFRLWQSFAIVAPNPGSCLKEIVKGSASVMEDPESKSTGQVFVASVEQMSLASTTEACPAGFLVRIRTKLYPRFSYGDRISFKGRLSSPRNFQSDGDRSFDFVGYLAKDDVYYEFISAAVSLEPPLSAGAWPESPGSIPRKLIESLFAVKRKFTTALKMVLGEPEAALAAGLVVGEKASLGNGLIADFRTVGLIHIVVLSGFNITIVGQAMRRLLSFLPRVWGIIFGGIGIALFGVLVGGGATVVRSCFMAGIALFADLVRRDYSVVRALMFAGLVMIIQNPLILLHDPSFQLSFLATLGLVFLASPFEKRLSFITEKFGIRGIVASTLATQTFVLPFILYLMGQLSLIGTFVNIIVLPFIPLTMLLVALTGLAGMISLPLAEVIGWGTHLLLSYELFIVEHAARLPFAALQVGVFSGWWVIGFYLILGVILIAKKSAKFKVQNAKSQL